MRDLGWEGAKGGSGFSFLIESLTRSVDLYGERDWRRAHCLSPQSSTTLMCPSVEEQDCWRDPRKPKGRRNVELDRSVRVCPSIFPRHAKRAYEALVVTEYGMEGNTYD